MMLVVTISLFVISIAAVIVLFLKDGWDDEIRYLGVRASFTVLGVGVFLLGVTFFQREWFMTAFFGTFLIITGIQVTLWSIGISLDFLANVPVDTGLRFWKSFYREERAVYQAIGNRLEDVIGLLNYVRHEVPIREYGGQPEHFEEKILNEVKTNIDEILKVVRDSSSPWDSRISMELIRISPALRFGPLQRSVQYVDALEELLGHLHRYHRYY